MKIFYKLIFSGILCDVELTSDKDVDYDFSVNRYGGYFFICLKKGYVLGNIGEFGEKMLVNNYYFIVRLSFEKRNRVER